MLVKNGTILKTLISITIERATRWVVLYKNNKVRGIFETTREKKVTFIICLYGWVVNLRICKILCEAFKEALVYLSNKMKFGSLPQLLLFLLNCFDVH